MRWYAVCGIWKWNYLSRFFVHQKQHPVKLTRVSSKHNFSNFRSLKAQLASVINSKPDIACAVALLAQQIEERLKMEAKSFLWTLMKLWSTHKTITVLFLDFQNLIKHLPNSWSVLIMFCFKLWQLFTVWRQISRLKSRNNFSLRTSLLINQKSQSDPY